MTKKLNTLIANMMAKNVDQTFIDKIEVAKYMTDGDSLDSQLFDDICKDVYKNKTTVVLHESIAENRKALTERKTRLHKKLDKQKAEEKAAENRKKRNAKRRAKKKLTKKTLNFTPTKEQEEDFWFWGKAPVHKSK